MGCGKKRRWSFLIISTLTALSSSCETSAGYTSTFLRSPAAVELQLNHTRLQRHSLHPHSPEQIHIALCGPGSISISWVRYSMAVYNWALPALVLSATSTEYRIAHSQRCLIQRNRVCIHGKKNVKLCMRMLQIVPLLRIYE
jgi:hypothetical protein